MCQVASEHTGKTTRSYKIRTRQTRETRREEVDFIVKGLHGCGLTSVKHLTLVLTTRPRWLNDGSGTCLSPFWFNSVIKIFLITGIIFKTRFLYWLTETEAHINKKTHGTSSCHALWHIWPSGFYVMNMFQVLRQKPSALCISSLYISKPEERAVNLN